MDSYRDASAVNPVSLGILILLCLACFFTERIEDHLKAQRHYWIPFSGGMACGYVFVYMLPKLNDYAVLYYQHYGFGLESFEYFLFFVAMIGFLSYLALGLLAEADEINRRRGLVLHAVGICLYNLLIGHLLVSFPYTAVIPALLSGLAVGVYLVGLNHIMFLRSPDFYRQVVRWVATLSIIAGAILGLLDAFYPPLQKMLTAFTAGAVLVILVKEKLPRQDVGQFKTFLLGSLVFVLLGMVVGSFSTQG